MAGTRYLSYGPYNGRKNIDRLYRETQHAGTAVGNSSALPVLRPGARLFTSPRKECHRTYVEHKARAPLSTLSLSHTHSLSPAGRGRHRRRRLFPLPPFPFPDFRSLLLLRLRLRERLFLCRLRSRPRALPRRSRLRSRPRSRPLLPPPLLPLPMLPPPPPPPPRPRSRLRLRLPLRLRRRRGSGERLREREWRRRRGAGERLRERPRLSRSRLRLRLRERLRLRRTLRPLERERERERRRAGAAPRFSARFSFGWAADVPLAAFAEEDAPLALAEPPPLLCDPPPPPALRALRALRAAAAAALPPPLARGVPPRDLAPPALRACTISSCKRRKLTGVADLTRVASHVQSLCLSSSCDISHGKTPAVSDVLPLFAVSARCWARNALTFASTSAPTARRHSSARSATPLWLFAVFLDHASSPAKRSRTRLRSFSFSRRLHRAAASGAITTVILAAILSPTMWAAVAQNK